MLVCHFAWKIHILLYLSQLYQCYEIWFDRCCLVSQSDSHLRDLPQTVFTQGKKWLPLYSTRVHQQKRNSLQILFSKKFSDPWDSCKLTGKKADYSVIWITIVVCVNLKSCVPARGKQIIFKECMIQFCFFHLATSYSYSIIHHNVMNLSIPSLESYLQRTGSFLMANWLWNSYMLEAG